MKGYLSGVAAVLAMLAGSGAARAHKSVTAEFNRVVLEHNVTWQGKKGMAIHVESTFTNAFKTKNAVVALFFDANGNAIASVTPSYRDANGNLKLADRFTASYFTNVRTSMLFLPYNEIDLGVGDHALTVKLGLLNETGSVHKRLAEKEEHITYNLE